MEKQQLRIKQFLKKITPAWIWNKLRLFRMKLSVTRFIPFQTEHTYHKFPLKVLISDPMAKGWYDGDWDIQIEIAFMEKYKLRPGSKIFDIGSHQGVVAMILGKIVTDTGFVVALEANKHNYLMGLKNIEMNHLRQIQMIHGAGDSKPGTLIFNEGLNGSVDDGSGDWGRVEVQAFAIDELSSQYGFPDVLFIDVEGYEGQVLEGAKETLSHPVDLFVEVHGEQLLSRFGCSVKKIIDFFPPSQFDLFYMKLEKEPLVIPLDLSKIDTRDRFYLFAISKKEK